MSTQQKTGEGETLCLKKTQSHKQTQGKDQNTSTHAAHQDLKYQQQGILGLLNESGILWCPNRVKNCVKRDPIGQEDMV